MLDALGKACRCMIRTLLAAYFMTLDTLLGSCSAVSPWKKSCSRRIYNLSRDMLLCHMWKVALINVINHWHHVSKGKSSLCKGKNFFFFFLQTGTAISTSIAKLTQKIGAPSTHTQGKPSLKSLIWKWVSNQVELGQQKVCFLVVISLSLHKRGLYHLQQIWKLEDTPVDITWWLQNIRHGKSVTFSARDRVIKTSNKIL